MQVTLHIVAAHVTLQLPWHLMSQDEPASQVTVLLPPRSNLQDAALMQLAVELAPAFSSHFDEPSHVI